MNRKSGGIVDSVRKELTRVSESFFEGHPFLNPFIVLFCCGVPWWCAFFPGTLQYDSCGQLLQYMGVANMTGHHPVGVSMLMGTLLDLGRILFHSDNMGIFLYTGLQFLAQCFVISYGFCVFQRFRVYPFWIRWTCLLYYALFPLIPNWGISFVKDTGYYICFLLLVLVALDAFSHEKKLFWWQKVLWICALVGLCGFRNDGRYVVLGMVAGVCIFRSIHRKIALIGGGICIGFLFFIEGIYMPLCNIPSGSVREALSVPLMQTANFLRQCEEAVTEEEQEMLKNVFRVNELNEIAEKYDNEISDDVKDLFLEYPSSKELFTYFKVWGMQLRKSPFLYLQTYFEHCRGYFDPSMKCYGDVMGWFTVLEGEERIDEYLNIHFYKQSKTLRNKMKSWTWLLYESFPFSLLFRPGIYTWVMFICLGVLVISKKWTRVCVILPGVVVLIICTFSPLNGSVRYYLPVMAAVPVYIACCFMKPGEESTYAENV